MIILRQKEYSTPLARAIAGFNKNILRKTSISSKRGAIKSQNKINNAINEGKSQVNQLVMNPGKFVNDNVISPAIETPLTTTALTLGVPVPGTEVLGKYVGKPEKMMWNKLGVGKKMRDLSNKYTNSNISKRVEGAVNGAIKGVRTTFIGF